MESSSSSGDPVNKSIVNPTYEAWEAKVLEELETVTSVSIYRDDVAAYSAKFKEFFAAGISPLDSSATFVKELRRERMSEVERVSQSTTFTNQTSQR